jgi:hypothetical protein
MKPTNPEKAEHDESWVYIPGPKMIPTRRGYVLLLQGTAKRSGETVIPLRKITNRDVAADEFGFAEAFVEHAVKAMGFLRVTLDAVAAVGLVLHCQKWLNWWGIGPKPPACDISHSSTGTCAARSLLGQNLPVFSPR